LRWPGEQLQTIYKQIIIREARASLEAQRRDMISACYSNPNWDGKDNSEKRKEYLRELNQHFDQASRALTDPQGKQAQESDVDWENPFFAAHKREIERTRELLQEQFGVEDKTAGELMAAEQSSNGHGDFDQIPRNN
jgi:hypothetical protein